MNFNDIVLIVDKSGIEYVKVEKPDGTVLWEISQDHSDYLVLTMKTTVVDEQVPLCYSREGIGYFDHFAEAVEELVIDGVVTEITPYHIFKQIGEHEVKYKFKNNEIPAPFSAAYGMFYNNTYIIKAVVGDNIVNVGHYAFVYCSKMTSFEGGDGMKQIHPHVLDGCTGLIDVVFGSKMKFISTFSMDNCRSIRNLTMKYDGVVEVNTFAGDPLEKIPYNANIYVPAEQVEKYQSDSYWKTRGEYIQAIK